MGTSMASVSFRRTDSMNRPDMRLRVEAMYQDVKGLVSNLDQGNNGCAIVSPHGDQETLLQNMADLPNALHMPFKVRLIFPGTGRPHMVVSVANANLFCDSCPPLQLL